MAHQSYVSRSEFQILESKCKQLEMELKLKQEAWKMKEEAWNSTKESWKFKEEAWKLMENTWKSKIIQTMRPKKPMVVDAFAQTDHLISKSESCQTNNIKRTDFQIQVDMEQEQLEMEHENEIFGSIKQEITEIITPNTSLSIQQGNLEALIGDLTSSSNDSSSDDSSNEDPKDDSKMIETPSSVKNPSNKNDDESVLKNSEVYKIYCQHNDPKDAIENIKKMKNCLTIIEGHTKNDQAEKVIEIGVKTIWKFFGLSTAPNDEFSAEMNLLKSFIGVGYVEPFVDSTVGPYNNAFKAILQRVITIKMIHANGFEYWIVKDFEKGPQISKWYRGHACESKAALRLAFLNLAAIKTPPIDTTKWGSNIGWQSFAQRFANDLGMTCKIGDFKLTEHWTVEISATLSFKENPTEQTNITGKTSRKRRWKTIEDMSDILKDRMKDEAQENAFKRFFYRYGILPGRSFAVDELRRFKKYNDW